MLMQMTRVSLEDLIAVLRNLQNPKREKKKENKVAIPKDFNRTPAKANTFLTEVNLFLMANKNIYLDDKDKILFTLSYMKDGHAAKWMEVKAKEYKKTLTEKSLQPTDMKPEDQIHVLMWEEFLEDFNKAFKPIDQGTNAQLKIKKLKQNKRHIDEYITDFCLLAADTEYNNRALIDHFMARLNLGLLSLCLLVPDQPEDIKEWYD
ncbi:hypothetical protein Moror_11100 [Moniliophthora roreri MCA 2997]|uniref:Retrotransposon gag domain-containing protein n=1 Tax=Moniliophthora roreri (strain MCA 2997) TaxID=1381753 RepID=V2WTZ9_MONRO|nr:hypothetical protein Moror_11100 [Moniliophthora roreri MCA 2997]